MDDDKITLQSFALAHIPELAFGILSIVITIALTEVAKPWVILALRKAKSPTALDNSIVRSLAFVLAIIPAIVLDFAVHLRNMTGQEFGQTSAILSGACLTWVGSQVAWLFAHDLRPVMAIRLWFYRKLGVEDLMTGKPK